MLRKYVIILYMPEDMSFTSNTEHAETYQRYQNFSSPTNAHVEFIKTKLKLGRLLQHVSVYKETIIREPVSA